MYSLGFIGARNTMKVIYAFKYSLFSLIWCVAPAPVLLDRH